MRSILPEIVLEGPAAVPGPIVFIGYENSLPNQFIENENPQTSPGTIDQTKTMFLEQSERWEWE